MISEIIHGDNNILPVDNFWQNNKYKRQWETKSRLKDMSYQVQRLVCMGNSVDSYVYDSETNENMINPSLTRGGNGRKQGGRSYWEYSAVFNKKLQQPIDVPDVAKDIFQGTIMETINWIQWCLWTDESGWTNDCIRSCMCEVFPKVDGEVLAIDSPEYICMHLSEPNHFNNLRGYVNP